jgi:uncharacterized protein (DUF2141 family)
MDGSQETETEEMKTLIAFVLSLLLTVSVQAESGQVGELTLVVKNVVPSQGEVRIALFDSKKTYTKTPVHAAVVKVKNGAAEWSVNELKPGEFAIALYHDANGDGKMNKNIIGLPKEDYGFSNNASGKFGPPSWRKAKFTVSRGTTKHTINLND